MSEEKKVRHILKFKRGDTYSVDVVIKMNDDFVFHNLVVPNSTPQPILEQFVHDAEVAAIGYIINEEIEKDAAH